MGSRRFFYFLPRPGESLDFIRPLSVLAEAGLALDPEVFSASLTKDGLAFDYRGNVLDHPREQELAKLLLGEPYVEFLYSDRRVMLYCSFGSQHRSPVFSISVTQRSWLSLPEGVRAEYEGLLVRMASEAGAASVLIINDPSDDFLGRIEPVDCVWMVYPYRLSGAELEPLTVWVDSRKGPCVAMRSPVPTGYAVGGFDEYRECLDAGPPE